MRANPVSAPVTPARAVDHEQDEVGVGDGLFRLLAHAVGDGAALRFLEAGGVDQAYVGSEKIGDALAAIARQAGQIGNERRARSREAVE